MTFKIIAQLMFNFHGHKNLVNYCRKLLSWQIKGINLMVKKINDV